MARTLGQWEARARELLGNPDAARLAIGSLEDYVRAAVRRFSQDRPRLVYSDYAGNGSTFDIPLPAGWILGFSTVQGIEYPQGERQPIFLDDKEILLYPSDSSPTVIRLVFTTPATGKTARVYFSLPWPIPDTAAATDKIADTDFEAVANLAASLGAYELAARAAGTRSSTIPAATAVGFDDESARWRSVASDKLKVYAQHVGIGAGEAGSPGAPPAMATTDWDALSTWVETGHRFLFRAPRR